MYRRKVGAVLPAVALIGGDIAFTGQARAGTGRPEPARAGRDVAVSKDSSAIVVPDIALTPFPCFR